MQIDPVTLIYFSPTSTTKQVLEYIAQGMEPVDIQSIDLTLPPSDAQAPISVHAGLAILGIPVYAGRVPLLALQRLQRIQAQEIPAVVVAVYGNRAYEDALVELEDVAEAGGFVPVAGAAFIGEHSFASEQTPIANGRPDENDCAEARAFGAKIKDMLFEVNSLEDLPRLEVPGNRPYKERPEKKEVAPVVDQDLCILCATCVELCPSGALSMNDAVHPDPKTCILCHACVKNCPTGAIAFQAKPLQELAAKLSHDCSERKEPELFITEGSLDIWDDEDFEDED